MAINTDSTMAVVSFKIKTTPVTGVTLRNGVVGIAIATTSVIPVLPVVPVAGNLLVATCYGTVATWVTPTGWSLAATSSTRGHVSIFWRVVLSGDGASWAFTSGVTDTLYVELEEFQGFPTGTITLDLNSSSSAGGVTSLSVTPGSTSAAIGLAKVAVCIGT